MTTTTAPQITDLYVPFCEIDDSQYEKPWVMDCGTEVCSDASYEAHMDDCEECTAVRLGEVSSPERFWLV